MTNLEKNALITLDNNANIQPKVDLDIVFSSADYDSGILNFQVLKNKRPLILGDPNVIGRIILKHSDNSVVVQKMEIDNKVNEFQFAYQVPNEILQRPGKVEAQITIAEKGNSNVVVAQRKFSFKIQNSLFSSVNAETKTTYIVEFQELQQQINNTVVDIQESIKNSQDYVTKIEEAKTLALSEISDKLQQSLTDFISTSDEKENIITTKGDKYIQDITNGGEDVNKAIKDFKDFMIDKDIVLNSQAENWQKYKLTEEDGTRIRISDIDPVELDTGFYQIWRMKNAPVGSDDNAQYWNVDVKEGADQTKQIIATISSTGETYKKNIHKAGDGGWLKQVLIGSDDVIVKQDSLHTQLSDLKQELKTYTDEKRKVLFEGSTSGVGESIALSDSLNNYNVIVVSGQFPGGRFNESHLLYNNEGIVVNRNNLTDSNGQGPIVYEVVIAITDDKNLYIKNEAINNVSTGVHNNEETHFEIKRIEGWK